MKRIENKLEEATRKQASEEIEGQEITFSTCA